MGVNVIAASLMPISQIAAWFALSKTDSASDPTKALYLTLGATAAFYCAWALFNVFVENDTNELGHYTMGLAAIGCFCQSKYVSLAGIGLVILNFILALFLVFGMSAADLAHAAKDSDTWAGIAWSWIFRAFAISSTVFWCLAFHMVLKIDTTSRAPYQAV